MSFCLSASEDVRARGFTVVVDMRGSKWDSVKPVLRTLQESFSSNIHTALLIKPDTFWQKHKTNLGSAKLSFEVKLLPLLILLITEVLHLTRVYKILLLVIEILLILLVKVLDMQPG